LVDRQPRRFFWLVGQRNGIANALSGVGWSVMNRQPRARETCRETLLTFHANKHQQDVKKTDALGEINPKHR
jgi:hypothetical protein